MKIGDTFWEYNADLDTIYPRKILSEHHIEYFKKGLGKRSFYTKEEAEKFCYNIIKQRR
jgi:hypothetical protein